MLPNVKNSAPDDNIFKGRHHTPEPPPTPGQLLRQGALILAIALYMVGVVVLFALAVSYLD